MLKLSGWKIALTSIFTLIVIALLCLTLLDCQKHKYVYIWQAYIFPVHEDGDIEPPNGFTGPWKTWNKNGFLKSIVEFEDGVPSGNFTEYYENGAVKLINKRHQQKDTLLKYNKNGRKTSQEISQGNSLVIKHFHDSGMLKSVVQILNGGLFFSMHWYKNGVVSEVCNSFQSGVPSNVLEFSMEGELSSIKMKLNKPEYVNLYDQVEDLDLRYKYHKEIRAFEKELRNFEKEHGLPASPSVLEGVESAKKQVTVPAD